MLLFFLLCFIRTHFVSMLSLAAFITAFMYTYMTRKPVCTIIGDFALGLM